MVAGAALLLAGCSQPAAQPQPQPGGQENPKPIQASFGASGGTAVNNGDVINGVKVVQISYNEDAQVREVSLYVDDKLVGTQSVTTSSAGGVKAQSLTAGFNVNTKACDVAKIGSGDLTNTGCSATSNTPVFPNGPHTVKAVLKNAVETKTISVNVTFNNNDDVLLSLSGNNVKDANNYTWYGGADLTVTAVPVSYSGKAVSKVYLQGTGNGIPNTTIGGSVLDADLGAGPGAAVEQPVSGGSATFTIAKAANNNVEGGIKLTAAIRYSDGSLSNPAGVQYYALDFKAPTYGSLKMKLNGVYTDFVGNIAFFTGGWLNGQSPLFAVVSDGGVGGATYQIKVLNASGNTVATLNPNDTLAAVAEAGLGTYDLQVVGVKDALGNTITPDPSALNGAGTYGLDKTAPTLSTTFAANGKTLNGTLAATSTDINLNLTESGSNTLGLVGGAAPSSSSAGTAGYIIQVAKSGCTYTLSNAGTSTLPSTTGPGFVRLPGTGAPTPSGCSTTYQAPGTGLNSPGDGNHTVTIQVVDKARNVSAPLSVNFYWLTTPPTVTFTQALPASLTLGSSAFVVANSTLAVSSPVSLFKAILYS
ncbi:MAG: hypothetical protein K6T35_07660, partial [Meiothermus silvanus]|nr:hypothetical protein [Allomeiothermus silvanus]